MPCYKTLMISFLTLAALNPAHADYDSTTTTSVLSRIDAILSMPDLHATLVQEGFRSGFFLNESGVEWSSLGSLMFAQIRTISVSFYHLWAGFENGAFLGYYQKDTLNTDVFSIAWQSTENHSCAYNYTDAAWDSAMNDPASGESAVTNPGIFNRFLPSRCREIFTANPVSGSRAVSVDASPYDCRYRSWYFDTKNEAKHAGSKRWTSMYIDHSTNNPAFALCAPLTNLTSKAPRFYEGLQADENGLVGVACTGLYIEAISKVLLALNSDMSTKGSFIVERSSGLLVAASSADLGDYYNAALKQRIAASASNNDYIRFATSSLTDLSWPGSFTGVVWVTSSDAANFPSLVEGDAYYLSTSTFAASGLTWDVVITQRVSCKVGEYVDTENLICAQCATPAFSTGNAPKTCDSCVATNPGEKGYFFKSASQSCEQCPAGAICRGLTWLPYPNEGHWVKAKDETHLAKDHPWCYERENCPGTINVEGGAAALACFESSAAFASCNVTSNDMVCREGSAGRLCGACTSGFDISAGEGCVSCGGSADGSLVFTYVLIGLALVFLYLVNRHFEWLRTQAWFKAVTGKGRFKILIATAQICASVQWTTRVVWGEPFTSFGRILSLFQLEFASVLPVGCAVDYSLIDQILMSTIVPLTILIFLRTPCFGVYGHALPRGDCINLILTVAFVVLPSTSLTLFRFFDCSHFPDGKAFLTADLTQQCYTPKYNAYLVYTSTMILLFPLGIPLAFFSLLYPRRELISSRDPEEPLSGRLHKVRFLVEDYKPSHWHGEILRSWMRVSLAGGVIVFTSSTAMRATYGSLLAFAFVIFQREYRPFKIWYINVLALGAQYQILFTYSIAFLLVVEPFAFSKVLIGTALFVVNLFVFLFTFWQQFLDARQHHRIKLLRAAVTDFSSSVVGVVGVRRPIGHQDLIRFVYGDWAVMSPQQRRKAARENHLDIKGCENEDELSRFLAVTVAAHESGVQAKWYWQEDADRMSAHDKASTYGECWVAYADSVAAQLEFFHNDQDSETTVVNVDVSGRVTSTSAEETHRGKAFRADTGTVYSVDLQRGVQINATSKFERNVMRQIITVGQHSSAGVSGTGAVAPTSVTIEQVGSALAPDDDNSRAKYHVDPRPFPADLAAAGEPILLMKPGMLVQIQKSRNEDGWAYGLVVYDSDEDAKLDGLRDRNIDTSTFDENNDRIQMTSTHANQSESKSSSSSITRIDSFDTPQYAEAGRRGVSLDRAPRGVSLDCVDFGDKGVVDASTKDNSAYSSRSASVNLDSRFSSSDQQGVLLNHKNAKQADEAAKEDEHEETAGSPSSGWFPLAFTGQPTVEEMHAFQEFLGGQGQAVEALAAPPTWSAAHRDPGKAARFVAVLKGSEEWSSVERTFKASLGAKYTKQLVEVSAVHRVENLPLWQAYAAKKKSLAQRAALEGLSSATYEMKDDKLMFHESSPDVIPKICQQGFNRSFCGKHDVKHGKGVYFATSSRVAHSSAKKDSKGVMRMFLCRVLAGEFCQGHHGELFPAERDSETGWHFDSTTDSLEERKRDVFVTYQDSQAYPEYLVDYSTRIRGASSIMSLVSTPSFSRRNSPLRDRAHAPN